MEIRGDPAFWLDRPWRSWAIRQIDAKWQPADLAELFMRETVAARGRRYFRMFPFSKNGSLEEDKASFLEGPQNCEKYINKNYAVASLCRSMPKRVDALDKAKGDHIHICIQYSVGPAIRVET